MRTLIALPVAALVALALAGCTGPSSTAPSITGAVTASAPPAVSASATDPSRAPASASSSASASSVPSSSSSTDADPGRPAGQCADSALKVTFGQSDGAAGSEDIPVVFTNTGATSCVLRGAPGVSVVGHGDGTQLGEPADRDQAGAKDVTLAAHGGQAHTILVAVNIGDNGGPLPNCTVEKGDGYRVYPPHSTAAFFVRTAAAPACAKGVWMHVGVVSAGAGSAG